MLGQFGAYSGLFIAAFLAATILPAQSEAGLAALILASPASVTLLVATASLGNILGSVVNWYLGRGINRFTGKSHGFRQPQTSYRGPPAGISVMVGGAFY